MLQNIHLTHAKSPRNDTSFNSAGEDYYYHMSVSPTTNFLMRLVLFLFFLVAMNTLIDAADLKKLYSEKYKEESERVGRWSVTRRV